MRLKVALTCPRETEIPNDPFKCLTISVALTAPDAAAGNAVAAVMVGGGGDCIPSAASMADRIVPSVNLPLVSPRRSTLSPAFVATRS